MREKIEEGKRPKEQKRETWMLEMPEEKAKNFGLGPRQFSKGKGDKGQRDKTWTETPEQRQKRERGLNEEEDEGKNKLFQNFCKFKFYLFCSKIKQTIFI